MVPVEFPLAYWLEQHGYDVTYVSNLDTHADPKNLLRAKGFLSVGHDEYYSIEMFNQLIGAIDAGLNVAFSCLQHLLRPDRPEAGASDGRPHRIFSRVDRYGPVDPEEVKHFPAMGLLPHASPNERTLVGARSTGHITGGADWACTIPDHWLFEGTGMKKGDAIPGLVGWEWHGDPALEMPGLQVVSTGMTTDGNGHDHGPYAATLYPGPKKNIVFNASTCWWADGLSEPPGYVRPKVYTQPMGPGPARASDHRECAAEDAWGLDGVAGSLLLRRRSWIARASRTAGARAPSRRNPKGRRAGTCGSRGALPDGVFPGAVRPLSCKLMGGKRGKRWSGRLSDRWRGP